MTSVQANILSAKGKEPAEGPDDPSAISEEELVKMLKDGTIKPQLGEPVVFDGEDGEKHQDFLKSMQLNGSKGGGLQHSGVGAGFDGVTPIEDKSVRNLTYEKDPMTCGTQTFAVVSIITPPQCNHLALKISGCFPDETSANEFAAELMNKVPYFDLYVVNMYNWLRLPLTDDDRLHIKTSHNDKELEKIIETFRKKQVDNRAKTRERMKASSDSKEIDEDPEEEQEVRLEIESLPNPAPMDPTSSSSVVTKIEEGQGSGSGS